MIRSTYLGRPLWCWTPRTVLLVAGLGLACGDGGNDDGSGMGSPGGGSRGGASGSDTENDGPAPSLEELAEQPTEEVDWTILVYGHGDHNLSNSLLVDLSEMARARLDDAVQVIVLTDWDSSQTIAQTDPPVPFPEGIQLFQVTGGGAEPVLLGEAEEANLDDPSVLATLVRDVFAAFPARRRGLVLWDHGGAWNGGFGGDSEDGTGRAFQAMGGELVAQAVSQGLSAAGVTDAPALDFLSFDTCLMAGAEVAYAFRDLASVYIADAEIDYGAGWDYERTLSYIAANPDAPAAELAVAEVTHWDAHHAGTSTNEDLLRSHVALDLSGMDALSAATSQLTSALVESASFDPIELGRSTFFSLAPYASEFEAGSRAPGLRDMGQFLDALAATQSDPAVALAAQNARDELDGLVLARSHGTLREAGGQAGFHVEQTLGSLVTEDLLQLYGTLASEWVGASRWDRLLALSAISATVEPPLFEHAVVNAEAASRAAPPALQFVSSDATVAQGAVYVATESAAGTALVLGLVGVGLVSPGELNEFAWNGSVLTFEDGQPGMVDVWLDVGNTAAEPILTIPGFLSLEGVEPALMNLVFDASATFAEIAVVSAGGLASTLTTAEIATAFPGATFTPLYLDIGPSSPEPSIVTGTPMPVPARGFPLIASYLPAGTYGLITTLTGVWGNSGSDIDIVTLTEPLGP